MYGSIRSVREIVLDLGFFCHNNFAGCAVIQLIQHIDCTPLVNQHKAQIVDINCHERDMILLILYELWNTTMWDVLQCVSQCVEYRAITVRIKLITHYRKVIYPWRMCNNYNLTCGARSTSSYCRIDALFQLFVCVCQIPTMH